MRRKPIRQAPQGGFIRQAGRARIAAAVRGVILSLLLVLPVAGAGAQQPAPAEPAVPAEPRAAPERPDERRTERREEMRKEHREAWMQHRKEFVERRERMTPDERRGLRRDLNNARRDLYRR